ncbi:HNH endonuclease signature motif containing protein [Herbaspirillum robiniae]|uniref:HNH endonuclease signature motif containing protein n=1 Tax=Herbaspirillum robiniae TaxID=2014887 RepID=UPI0009A1421A
MLTAEKLMSRTIANGECLEWSGSINKTGYGCVWANGRTRQAHRVSFELHHGEIPNGSVVMHTCDNRKCINPIHLVAGTRVENMQDMLAKKRNAQISGVKHHNSKLTPELAQEIRERYVPYDRKNGSSALAREFEISQPTVHSVIRGVTWKEST